MGTFAADSNAWYHITESGVGFAGSLGCAGASETDASAVFIHTFNATYPGDLWQILPISNTTFVFRSKLGTSQHQLDVNLNPKEKDRVARSPDWRPRNPSPSPSNGPSSRGQMASRGSCRIEPIERHITWMSMRRLEHRCSCRAIRKSSPSERASIGCFRV